MSKVYKKTETKYYKYNYQDWVRPNLTANGVMGGDSFACSASAEYRPAYGAFDGVTEKHVSGDTLTHWASNMNDTTPQWIAFYNPIALKISDLTIYQYYNTADGYTSFYIKDATIQGSDNGRDWEDLATITGTEWVRTLSADLSDCRPYMYYRIYINDRGMYNSQYSEAIIHEIEITAQEAVEVEVTKDDEYDMSREVTSYLLTKKDDKFYAYKGV